MLVLDILPFADRANMAAVCSQLRPLALKTIDKFKVMKDMPCMTTQQVLEHH